MEIEQEVVTVQNTGQNRTILHDFPLKTEGCAYNGVYSHTSGSIRL